MPRCGAVARARRRRRTVAPIDTAGVLTIIPGSGNVDHELTLERLDTPEPDDAPTTGAVAGSWVLSGIVSQTGEPAPLPEGLVITVELDDGGAIRGSAGCSDYEGTYALDGATTMTIVDLTIGEATDCDPMYATWQ